MAVERKPRFRVMAMAYKILHFADLHLDTSFVQDNLPSEYGRARRLSLRAALTRLFAKAREMKVDAITIAGDLFDQRYLLPETADFLLTQFTKIAPIRVIIAPGENDPYTNDSIYARLNWPDNVDIFYQNKLTALELAPKIHLWGAANPPARDQRLLEGLKLAEGTNLLILHCAVKEQKRDQTEPVHLLDATSINKAGFSLALLGHEHIGQTWETGQTKLIYPGSPEPLKESESPGHHHCVLVEIEGKECSLTPIPSQDWHYSRCEVDLTGCETLEKTARKIKASLSLEKGWRAEQTIFYVTLTGMPGFLLGINRLRELVNTPSYLHIETRLGMKHDLRALGKEQTVRGFLVQRYLERLESSKGEEERRLLLSALNLALQALDGREVSLHEVAEY